MLSSTLRSWCLLIAVGLSLAGLGASHAAESPRWNVLFIAIDDMRPNLGCYGDRVVRTPNMDRLAARGLLFNRAYCQQPLCSPSRSSMLTGRRPDTTRVYDLETHFRTTLPDVVTLPEQFKNQGYVTQGLSKIYHNGLDDSRSWSVPHWDPPRREREGGRAEVFPSHPARVPDDQLPDVATATQAIDALKELKDRPFFLAVGFVRPHTPYVAPARYFDMYPPEKLRLPANQTLPKDAPACAREEHSDLGSRGRRWTTGPETEDEKRKATQGYYACITYVDDQVGRVLGELDRLGLTDKTIVMLFGDHGYNLGEHGMWSSKNAVYAITTRVPLIVAVPGRKSAGKKTDALVEFVDAYPTLTDLCGLPRPEGLEGTSFAPLLDAPDRPWKTAAFSQTPREIAGQGLGMGRAIRTDRYRLVEWSANRGSFREVELYDEQKDPDETVNIARAPENAERVRKLTAQLHAGWRAALPPEKP